MRDWYAAQRIYSYRQAGDTGYANREPHKIEAEFSEINLAAKVSAGPMSEACTPPCVFRS